MSQHKTMWSTVPWKKALQCHNIKLCGTQYLGEKSLTMSQHKTKLSSQSDPEAGGSGTESWSVRLNHGKFMHSLDKTTHTPHQHYNCLLSIKDKPFRQCVSGADHTEESILQLLLLNKLCQFLQQMKHKLHNIPETCVSTKTESEKPFLICMSITVCSPNNIMFGCSECLLIYTHFSVTNVSVCCHISTPTVRDDILK